MRRDVIWIFIQYLSIWVFEYLTKNVHLQKIVEDMNQYEMVIRNLLNVNIWDQSLSRHLIFVYFPIISHHKFHILSTEGGWLTLFSSHILDLMRKRTTNRDVQSGRPQFHLYFRIQRQSFSCCIIRCGVNEIAPCLPPTPN